MHVRHFRSYSSYSSHEGKVGNVLVKVWHLHSYSSYSSQFRHLGMKENLCKNVASTVTIVKIWLSKVLLTLHHILNIENGLFNLHRAIWNKSSRRLLLEHKWSMNPLLKNCFLFSLSEWCKNKLRYFKLAKELEIIMSEEYLHWVGFH